MENPAEPTNADLVVLIENQTDAFKEHAADDHRVAKKQGEVNQKQDDVNIKMQRSLAELHEWKETVATKDDIAELKQFMKSFNIGVGIFKFSWNNAAKIGSFVLLIGGIFFFFKAGIIAFFAWVTTNSPIR